MGGFFQVQFYLTMGWFESRLNFQASDNVWKLIENWYNNNKVLHNFNLHRYNSKMYFAWFLHLHSTELEVWYQFEWLPPEWNDTNMGPGTCLWKHRENLPQLFVLLKMPAREKLLFSLKIPTTEKPFSGSEVINNNRREGNN